LYPAFLQSFGEGIEGSEDYRKFPKKSLEKSETDLDFLRKSLKQSIYAVFRNDLCVSKAERRIANLSFVRKTERNTKIETKSRPIVLSRQTQETIEQLRFGH
jgi:hypothetical protein